MTAARGSRIARLSALRVAVATAMATLAAACSTGGAPAPPAPTPVTPSPSSPTGTDLPVIEHTLANGMHFLLLPRPGPPTVSFVAHVPVGSVHDPEGRSGISHFVEHLLFKGTTTIGTSDAEAERVLLDRIDAAHLALLPIEALEDSARAFVVPNEFASIYAANGARGLNATTDHEATRYFVELPANRAELWFAMEADRMRNPVFREFFTEREVIAEERRLRVDASPGGALYEAHMTAAFPDHPYGSPPAGTMADILTLSRADVREHFERYYGPNNTVVAIVGDIRPDSMVAWAERYFGPIPRGAPPPPGPGDEAPQTGERRVEVRRDAEPEIRIGWRVPSALAPEAPALNVLANLLVVGRDSRLYRRLVRDDRLATSVTVSGGPGSRSSGLFTIHAIPRAPHDPAAVEAAIHDEIARLLVDPPTPEELGRVARRLEAGEVRRLTSNQGLAAQLADARAVRGDWRETFEFIDRMTEVDAEDLVDLVRRYFIAEGRTVAVLRRAEP